MTNDNKISFYHVKILDYNFCFLILDNDNDGRTDEDCYDYVRCRETRMEIDDRIDNDCDGEVDEELCDDDIGL